MLCRIQQKKNDDEICSSSSYRQRNGSKTLNSKNFQDCVSESINIAVGHLPRQLNVELCMWVCLVGYLYCMWKSHMYTSWLSCCHCCNECTNHKLLIDCEIHRFDACLFVYVCLLSIQHKNHFRIFICAAMEWYGWTPQKYLSCYNTFGAVSKYMGERERFVCNRPFVMVRRNH